MYFTTLYVVTVYYMFFSTTVHSYISLFSVLSSLIATDTNGGIILPIMVSVSVYTSHVPTLLHNICVVIVYNKCVVLNHRHIFI